MGDAYEKMKPGGGREFGSRDDIQKVQCTLERMMWVFAAKMGILTSSAACGR